MVVLYVAGVHSGSDDEFWMFFLPMCRRPLQMCHCACDSRPLLLCFMSDLMATDCELWHFYCVMALPCDIVADSE